MALWGKAALKGPTWKEMRNQPCGDMGNYFPSSNISFIKYNSEKSLAQLMDSGEHYGWSLLNKRQRKRNEKMSAK